MVARVTIIFPCIKGSFLESGTWLRDMRQWNIYRELSGWSMQGHHGTLFQFGFPKVHLYHLTIFVALMPGCGPFPCYSVCWGPSRRPSGICLFLVTSTRTSTKGATWGTSRAFRSRSSATHWGLLDPAAFPVSFVAAFSLQGLFMSLLPFSSDL